MKTIVSVIFLTVFLYSCSNDNPVNNNNNPPVNGDSSITLMKDTLIVFPYSLNFIKFGNTGTDSINCIFKIQFKATWQEPGNSDTLEIAVVRRDASGDHILDTLYTNLVQKNYLYIFDLNTNNEYANQLWFGSVKQLYLYEMKAFKN